MIAEEEHGLSGPETSAREKPPVPKKRLRGTKRRDIGRTVFIVSMLAIPIVSWLVFWLYTNSSMIIMAFQSPMGEWTFQNFVTFWHELTAPKSDIGISLRNTFLYFGLNNLIMLPLGTLVAYFIYKKVWGYKFFRVAIFLTSIIPGVVMITCFKEMIKPWGPLASLGVPFPETGLLANNATATPMVMFYCFWTGYASTMLLMCGAMSRIPTEVFEALKLDGCGPFREFTSFVVPLIWPTLSMQIIFNLTGLFNSSGPILLMTGGAYETSTLNYWIFINTYRGTAASGAYNTVSATGLVFTIVALPLILLVRWLTEKVEAVEY